MIKTRSGTNNRKQGISLIEILLAAGVLAAMMAPVFLTFGTSSQGIVMTSEEFIAHAAGIEILEQTMAVPFAILPLGSFKDSQIQDGKKLDPKQSSMIFRISEVEGAKIERELAITALFDNKRIRFKKVEVKIHWFPMDGKKSERTIVLKGLLANEEN